MTAPMTDKPDLTDKGARIAALEAENSRLRNAVVNYKAAWDEYQTQQSEIEEGIRDSDHSWPPHPRALFAALSPTP